jgi:hypothetical protein
MRRGTGSACRASTPTPHYPATRRFCSRAAFSGANGELRFEKQASDTYVYGDTNGDKAADFVIHFDDCHYFRRERFFPLELCLRRSALG